MVKLDVFIWLARRTVNFTQFQQSVSTQLGQSLVYFHSIPTKLGPHAITKTHDYKIGPFESFDCFVFVLVVVAVLGFVRLSLVLCQGLKKGTKLLCIAGCTAV